MNNFILYRHIRPDKNQVFYIGIGSYARAYDFKWGRNKHWTAIHGQNNEQVDVEIMADELSWQEACSLERWWIAFYGRSDLGKGTLCNLTDGGEGAQGRKKSKETVEKQKRTLAANGGHGMLNKHHTPEARAKISEAGRRKKSPEEIAKIKETRVRNGNWGFTKDSLEKSRLANIGRPAPNRIGVINILTGIIYVSIIDASTKTCTSRTTMQRWCKNNNNGYKFI